ncbi:probable C-mannosyltransferase DPY19L4 isoform X5 [Esox lucius]|uniref:probable C-mannosyltransferase DPY19L4 isoform X5 n=1 Tax=Esox lucius TaxID=8010 RepID=UPI0009731E95|nr:probable C-mannosyltransferase DPY19L4 isoform X5 [Esox lucius]
MLAPVVTVANENKHRLRSHRQGSLEMAELRCRKTVVREGECEGEEQKQSESAPQIENSIKVDKDSLMEMCSKNTNGAGGAFCCNQEEQKDEKEEKEKNIKEVADGQNPCPVKRARNACRSLLFQRLVKLFFGCLAAVTCGMMYAVYLSTYHERKFWFSSRQELEREITFQGGSGVYYYYYKHMLTAPSFERGIYELMRDNRTISGQTINTVEHLSLYPELVTSLLYRITGCQDMIEPVYFYIGVVFGLQAVYITALFVSSWMLSGTWVAGMLAVAWYIINRPDTTKVDYAIPQRDNWVLPYFSCQVAALTGFLSDNINSATEMFCYLLMSASTLTFILVWEHSHYVLFIQGLALFFLDSFDLVQSRKRLMPVGDSDFILKFLEVKFGLNTTTDFVINQLLCQECFQTPSQDFFLRLTQASILPFYLLVLLICLMSILETIYRRLSGEPMKTNIILEDGRIGERPEVIYHVFHTMLFGALAMVFEGIKYLWTPYVCMFTAFGVCSPELWMTVFRWLKLKSIHPVVLALVLSTAVPTIIGFSLWREYFPHVIAELSELQEFHDPDTVELMTWIKTHAPMAAVFAGSPQLLGLVKLCSGLAVTSLPLYSDINLQKRSEDTYQVYAMRSAEDVYKILSLHKTSYVIIEESLCNEYHKGCRIKDLLDIANGHVCIKHHSLYSNHTLFTHFDNIGNINIGYMQYMILLSCKLHFFLTLVVALCPQQVVYDKGEIYSFSKHGRFCHEIKLNYSPYTNYFSRVFWNRSYHIYKVNSVISFQY